MSNELKLFRVFYLREGSTRSQTFPLSPTQYKHSEKHGRLLVARTGGLFLRVEPIEGRERQLNLFPDPETTEDRMRRIDGSLTAAFYCGIGIILSVVIATAYHAIVFLFERFSWLRPF